MAPHIGSPIAPRRSLVALGLAPRGLLCLLPLLLVGLVAGCFPGPVSVPPGGQEVHVTIDGNTITLQPTTVQAGEVFLVLDVPGTNVTLVQRMASPDETPGPLTTDDLDRLARGDTFHMAITAGFANGEPYGNVSALELTPGLYAFLAADPTGREIPPESMAVLEVVP